MACKILLSMNRQHTDYKKGLILNIKSPIFHFLSKIADHCPLLICSHAMSQDIRSIFKL